MEKHSMFMIRRLNIVNIAMLPKLIYRFKAIPIRIPAAFVAEIGKLILKFIRKCKGPRIDKRI